MEYDNGTAINFLTSSRDKMEAYWVKECLMLPPSNEGTDEVKSTKC